ncbi:N1221-domain-containing protein, partial [Saccharata proteae CBS 121410]
RPTLKREKSVPAPQRLPPPAPPAPPLETGQPTDSLSLMQLKKLVTEMPRTEPTPYAFVYEDASSFTNEVDEWFSYSVEEQAILLKTQLSFSDLWISFVGVPYNGPSDYQNGDLDWCLALPQSREAFVRKLIGDLQQPSKDKRLQTLEALVYLSLGCWYETAGHRTEEAAKSSEHEAKSPGSDSDLSQSQKQIEWIRNNIEMIFECDGLRPILDITRSACCREFATDIVEQENTPIEERELERRELWCALTLIYMFHEAARTELAESGLRQKLTDIPADQSEPSIPIFLIQTITSLRWDDSAGPPLHKILLLTWKSILLSLGGLEEVEKIKATFRDETEETADNRGQPLITASPLDYHLFRQEISSKYPAYNPPPPLFPLEPENNSILPPLKNISKASDINPFGPGLTNVNNNGTSILHQPVHIATPAPSPPPSPAGPGGKGGKKQNYQTNQLFPFLYPPLDETSNNLGGKGTTDLQDLLVGRRWEGSDIPASILEAAELFAKRMRATRAMKQLWQERALFMKYERGWTGPDDGDVDHLDLDARLRGLSVKAETGQKPADAKEKEPVQLRLVEDFYSTLLPHLQSLVIVLLRTVLAHLATLATQSQLNGANSVQGSFQDNQNGNKSDGNGSASGSQPDVSKISLEELDRIRTEEIQNKAATGLLLLLLKWFKVSHVLKFEYLAQLLVDSNYIPLTLKLLQVQEIEKAINYRSDREDLDFFNFCLINSREGSARIQESSENQAAEESSEDEAAPPPIARNRNISDPPPGSPPTSALPEPPQVDELGIPTSTHPAAPITNFSWRNFFTNINLLRIMQKVCKHKAHRNLMLVQYKSSQYLRKSLKIPQPELRLYTLKLFKNQVPYCGRKWRQSNMRVITAVYLHCRPELRDDWLAGSDVDADVDESVPLEQALRALTHWFNLKRYPDAMGADAGVLEREQDFFRKELESMGWGQEEVGQYGMGDEESQWEGQMQEG